MTSKPKLRVGDRVAFTRSKTADHYEAGGMPRTGIVVRVDEPTLEELRQAKWAPSHWRPVDTYTVVNEWFFSESSLLIEPEPEKHCGIVYTRDELRLLDRRAGEKWLNLPEEEE